MEYFSGILRFLHRKNKTPKPKEPIRFEVKLLELQSFVDSYVPKAKDSHSPETKDSNAPEAEDSHAPEAKDPPPPSAEDTRKVLVKTNLKDMMKNGAEISRFGKKRVVVRFEEVGKNEYVTLGLIRPDFWLSRRTNLRQGGFRCSLSMEAVKELEIDIDKWKSTRKS